MTTLGIIVIVIISVLLGFFLRSVIYYAKQGAKVGATAPAFYGQLLDGSQIGSTEWMMPNHPILLVFISHKCNACKRMVLALDRLKKKYPRTDIDVLLMGANAGPEIFGPWKESLVIDLPLALDPSGVSQEHYGVYSLPAAFYISTKGLIRWNHRGFKQGDEEILKKAFKRRRRILKSMRK